jgi:ribosomal protein S18 acetylase RimI-like enzyme
LNIRDAGPDDRRAVLDLTLSAYEEYAPFMPYWRYYRGDIVATLEDPEPGEQILAEQDGIIVGSVLLYPAGTVFSFSNGDMFTLSWPEVRLLAVAPAARGQSIGTALMDECIRRARKSGGQFLTLHTNSIMSTAIRLYERMGFEHRPERDFPVDENVTVKEYRFDLRLKRMPGTT